MGSDPTFLGRLRVFAGDIKVSHTVFAMPWALLATFLAAGGWPDPSLLFLIVLCMVMARTVAMGANRLLDMELDAVNPRTAGRALPSGRIPRSFVSSLLLVAAVVFIGSTGLFWVGFGNPWPIILSGPVLLTLCTYPLLKRFTHLCHYYLGAALGLAPVCAWIAVGGIQVPAEVFLIGLAVLLWTAGFDIIYACQDVNSDRETGVLSVPARSGVGRALWIARMTHLACLVVLVLAGLRSPVLGALYFVGVACAAVLMVVEHTIVRPGDLSKLNMAFFTINGIISVVIGLLGIADVLAG